MTTARPTGQHSRFTTGDASPARVARPALHCALSEQEVRAHEKKLRPRGNMPARECSNRVRRCKHATQHVGKTVAVRLRAPALVKPLDSTQPRHTGAAVPKHCRCAAETNAAVSNTRRPVASSGYVPSAAKRSCDVAGGTGAATDRPEKRQKEAARVTTEEAPLAEGHSAVAVLEHQPRAMRRCTEMAPPRTRCEVHPWPAANPNLASMRSLLGACTRHLRPRCDVGTRRAYCAYLCPPQQ